MTKRQAFDQTILKFEKLVEEGREPGWKHYDCPLCGKFLNENYDNCTQCPFRQYEMVGNYGCIGAVRTLDIEYNSYEILLMLYQARIYLYGEEDF